MVRTTSRALLIATPGGHLTQLMTLLPRLGISADDAVWVSIPTPQSRSLLADREVIWAPYTSPRDLRGLAAHVRIAINTLRRHRFEIAVSTGASLAPPFLSVARSLRTPSHYIESATRVQGPSFSGRMVARIPGVHTYSQYETWANARWLYRGSIFEGWRTQCAQDPPKLRRALVTVGSARGFPFERMLRSVAAVLPSDCEVTWQILDARPSDLPGRVVSELNAQEFRDEVRAADVVISHAGTGSAITALELGRCPVLVPRSAAHGEHVDDHQAEIAAMLERRQLAVVASPESLTATHLRQAAARSVTPIPGPRFELAS